MVSTREFRDVFRVEYHTTGAEKAAADAGKVAASTDAISAAVTQQAGKVEGLNKGLAAFARQNDAVFRAQEQVNKAQRLLKLGMESGLQDTLAYTRALAGLAAKEQQLADVTTRSARATQAAADARLKAVADAAKKMGGLDYGKSGSFLNAADVAKVQAQLIPLIKYEQEYAEAVQKADAALAARAISQKQRDAVVAQATARLDNQRVAALKANEATERLAKGASLNAYAWQNLGFQLNDVFTSIASGISPMQTIAQQGGQVYQIMSSGQGGIGGAIKDVGGAISRFLTPAVVTVGALSAAAIYGYTAWNRYDSEQRKVGSTLQGLGRNLGMTRAQFEELAASAALAGNMTVRQASNLGSALAASGKIGAENIQRIIALSKNMAATFGTDLDGISEKLVSSFSTADGVRRLNSELGFLDARTSSYIQKLFETGRAQDAIRLATERAKGALASYEDAQGGVARVWKTIKDAASEADLAVGRFLDRIIKGPNPSDRLKELQENVIKAKQAAEQAAPVMQETFNPTVKASPAEPKSVFQETYEAGNVTDFRLPDPAKARTSTQAVNEAEAALKQYMDTQAKAAAAEEAATKQRAADKTYNERSQQLKNQMNQMNPLSEEYRQAVTIEESFKNAQKEGNAQLIESIATQGTFADMVDAATRARKSQEDAAGKELSQMQRNDAARQVEIAGVRARTVAGQAAVASQRKENEQVAKFITTAEAEAAKRHEAQMVRERANQQLLDMVDDQKHEADSIRDRISLLNEDAETQAVVTARRKAAEEITRKGIDTNEALAQTIINGAEANARLEASYNRIVEQQRRIQEGVRELGSSFTTFIDDLVLGTGTLSDALENLSRSLSSNVLQGIMTGQGPFAGLLGTSPTTPGGMGGLLGGQFNFGGLIDSKAIGDSMASAIKEIMPESMSGAMAPLLTPKAGQGLMSTPLMGGLMAGGAGAAIGYSSQSPMMGALGGGLTGLATGGIPGALIGAAGGILGGIFGNDAAKEARQKEIIEAAAEAVKALQQARPQIEMMRATFTGEGVGTLERQLAEALVDAKAARQTALKAGAKKLAQEIGRDMGEYERRMVAAFKASFDGTVRAMESGEGLDSAFATSAAAATALGEALKGFVGDADRLGKAAVAQARTAAIATALDSLQAPEELSEVQTQLRELEGTGTALRQVLEDLGMSAKKAADAIRDQTKKALDELRDSFAQDLRSKINDAAGKSYLNEVGDLVSERAALLADAKELGVSGAQVNRYFTLAAQGIVDEADLTGKAFRRLVKQFPELRGSVKAAAKEVEEAVDTIAEKAEAANRIASYRDRVLMAGLDQSTLRGQLAAYNRQALRERQALDDMDATQREMRELEKAQNAERLQIQRDFMKQEREERQEANRQALEDLRDFTRDIKAYLAGLRGGSDSPLSPGDRQTAAQANFNRLLTLAQGGDQDAMGSITGAADLLLQAARDNFASGEGYQNVFAQVTTALEALPSQITANEMITDAIRDMRDVLKAAINASPAATAGALNANFTKLDSTMNGRLSKAELIDGLGPLATAAEQRQAKAVFDKLDTNGSGQLEKQELLRQRLVDVQTNTNSTRASVDTASSGNNTRLDGIKLKADELPGIKLKADDLPNIKAGVDGTKTTVASGNSILSAINTSNQTQKSTLQLLYKQYAFEPVKRSGVTLNNNMLTALNKIVYNTANTVSALKTGTPFTYATGGYTGHGGKYEVAGAVHKGEYVLNADVTRRLGVPLLDAINDNRAVPMPMPGESRPAPIVAGGGLNTSAIVAEIRALRSENNAQAEMIARMEKQTADKVVDTLEDVEEAVKAGGGRREGGRQVAGRGQRVRRRRAA